MRTCNIFIYIRYYNEQWILSTAGDDPTARQHQRHGSRLPTSSPTPGSKIIYFISFFFFSILKTIKILFQCFTGAVKTRFARSYRTYSPIPVRYYRLTRRYPINPSLPRPTATAGEVFRSFLLDSRPGVDFARDRKSVRQTWPAHSKHLALGSTARVRTDSSRPGKNQFARFPSLHRYRGGRCAVSREFISQYCLLFSRKSHKSCSSSRYSVAPGRFLNRGS